MVGGGVTSASGAPASSWASRENTVIRVQPSTEQGISRFVRVAIRLVSSSHRRSGGGCRDAKAVICSAAVQVHVPVHPGRAQRRSTSDVARNLSRQGSHIRDVGSLSLAGGRPPSLALLPAIWIHVREQPGTEQGIDLAPSRSASVKPNVPMAWFRREPMLTTTSSEINQNLRSNGRRCSEAPPLA